MPRNETFILDDAVFQSKMQKLIKKWKVDEKKFVAEQAGLFLYDVARYVPPYAEFPDSEGKSMGRPADKMTGKKAILKDLAKIFTRPSSVKIFNWADKNFKGREIRKGKEVIGAGTINSLAEMKKFHNAMRKPSNGRTRTLRPFQKMWVKKAMFNKYVKSEQKDVGIAKATIAWGVLKFNPKAKIPAWIFKQILKANASAKMVKLKAGWSANFTGKAFGLQHVKGKSIHIIQRRRLGSMEKRLQWIFKKATKDSGWFTK